MKLSMKRIFNIVGVFVFCFFLAGCGKDAKPADTDNKAENKVETEVAKDEKNDENKKEDNDVTKVIVDSLKREVTVPKDVKKIVCVGVGTLRYTCYMDSEDLIVGVEDHEKKEPVLARPYNYVNFDKFKDLPGIGDNGEPNIEKIIELEPDVILAIDSLKIGVDELQEKTNIPVVSIPIADSSLDERNYEIFRILGELYNKEDKAKEMTTYLDDIKKDLNKRTGDIKAEEKPSVYVAGLSFKGSHGFEGTEANYGPLTLSNSRNLADDVEGQDGFFEIDLEKVLEWDPDIILIDFNGYDIIKDQYAKNKDLFESLSAVKNGKVYSQISYRHCATNLDTALIDAYYAGKVSFPDKFEDVDMDQKAKEIYEKFIGEDIYPAQKEAGLEFRKIEIGK
ncbi:iron ABC transporter substrate-binding protein [uncultured Anaerococcus sp.]|uniref:iron ABC transporter substrate-binding protein n=1 Tax=uncultured Anaerococcus sp. TaxID=293428 RepID=UPI00288A046B|nr:iron ABC transporter substrate-binding protein [uncultured Anaerococcus sp.]